MFCFDNHCIARDCCALWRDGGVNRTFKPGFIPHEAACEHFEFRMRSRDEAEVRSQQDGAVDGVTEENRPHE